MNRSARAARLTPDIDARSTITLVSSLTDDASGDASGESLAPAERLRARLTTGIGRLSVVAAMVVIWAMDTLLSRRLVDVGAIDGTHADLILALETTSTIVFVITSVLLAVAVLRPWPHRLFQIAGFYAVFSVIQVIANVVAMVSTAHLHGGSGLAGLWDVAAVYGMSVSVFTFVYVLLDVTTPGGAFVWPARDGQPAPTPNVLDYLFISLNVNSTYGPTSEAVMSRRAKLVMSMQVMLAILMLTVLIARAVSATT